MHAYFDAQDGSPKVVIKIRGTPKGKQKDVAALLDTGHSGSLSLPTLDLIEIGAKLDSFGPARLADGNRVTVMYFKVYVEIDGKQKEVQAGMIDNPEATEAIVGLELLTPYIVLLNFEKKTIYCTTEEEIKRKK